MNFTSIKYHNSDNTIIEAVVDGVTIFIPVQADNMEYREIVKQNITPDAYTP